MLVLAIYYWNLKSECTALADQRAYFMQQVQQVADSDSLLKLTDVTAFPWQWVKGFTAFKPQHQTKNCPFEWDWSNRQRQEIIDAGQLSVLIFIYEGAIANYIEFRSEFIKIDDFEKNLTPETAVFKVQKKSSFELKRVVVEN